jgi:glycosyltransferase involved in cell wall biosynthesis
LQHELTDLPDMRILHLDSGRALRGGQKQILLLLRGLRQRGHEILLGCREGKLCEAARAAGIPVEILPLRGEWDLPSAWRIRRLADSGFDLIHTHDAHTHTLARLAQALGMKTPLAVHRRVDFPIAPGAFNRWKYLRGVTAFIVISRAIGRRLEELGVAPERIHPVPSSVDHETLDREASLPFPAGLRPPEPDEILFTCVGALEEEKGQHFLLSCIPSLLPAHPRLLFYFLGEGPWRQKLEQLARTLGVAERCCFPGYVTPVAPVLKRSAGVVLPTLSEGLSSAALEAMALGIPVAASATGGLPEIIDSGENGLLFSPGDLDGIQLALRRLIEDPELKNVLGKKALQKARSRFTSEIMVDATERVYQEILG